MKNLSLPPSLGTSSDGKDELPEKRQAVPPCLGGLPPGLLRAVLRDRQGGCLCLVGGIMGTVTFCHRVSSNLRLPTIPEDFILCQCLFLGTHLFLPRTFCHPTKGTHTTPPPPKKRTFKVQISDLTL